MDLLYLIYRMSAYTKHNIECGIYSGIPKCCVLWQTLCYMPFERLDHILQWKIRPEWHKKASDILLHIINPFNRLGRIACPKCQIFGKPIVMKRCNGHVLCRDHLKGVKW